MRDIRLLFATIAASLAATSVAHAGSVTIDVKIQSVDLEARTITVLHGDKERSFDLLRKTEVFVAGETSDAASLVPGDQAKLTYEESLDVVLKIEAEGKGTDQWRFFDILNKGAILDQCVATTRDGTLICLRDTPLFCLASPRPYSEMTLTLEFQIPPRPRGSAAVYVASSLPRPSEKDWKQQIPLGLEFKLGPAQAGDLIVPTTEFKLELPLGQLRDGRRIVALHKLVLKPTGWNTLEVICDKHSNVTFKVNGETINAVAKVENAKGYILIGPYGMEFRVRNVVVRTHGEDAKLPFDMIRTK